MDDFRLVADKVAAAIADGRLKPGEKLMPQRMFARRHRMAASTAARVYQELVRRGLVVGEVGRGTFVRAGRRLLDTPLAEPAGAHVDLELNFPLLAEQAALMSPALIAMLRPDVLTSVLPPVAAVGTARSRRAAAGLLAHGGWTPDPEGIVFAGNGRQAIAAVIAALVPIGERLGVEPLTYPVVKGIAARLGVELVPVPMDEHGMDPQALQRVHRATPLRAVYLQPTLHNPLGITMPRRRRRELARLFQKLTLYAIEDAIYTFLDSEHTPLAALAPEHVFVVDSLSKRLAPGLTLGVAHTPYQQNDRVKATVRSGGWAAHGFALEVATRWIEDGTVAAVAAAKRQDAAARQDIARNLLAGFTMRADPHAYHCWWELPEPWRAETFVAAAARRGIAVSPGAAFAVGSGHSPNAVRLALASPATDTLSTALAVLATLARAPEDMILD